MYKEAAAELYSCVFGKGGVHPEKEAAEKGQRRQDYFQYYPVLAKTKIMEASIKGFQRDKKNGVKT